MIRELLTYISERPKLSEAKSFGHLIESISLLSREARCKKSWGPHRKQCQDFISSNLKHALHNDSVLVLGSGPLHEIPITILAKYFKKVVLVDIVHLKSTKRSITHLQNIEFIEHDISEIENQLHKSKKLFEKVPEKFLDQNWGLVLSINIMSQLPIHLQGYIDRKLARKFSKDDVEAYLKAATKNHLDYLLRFNSPAILITDTETNYYDKSDSVIQTDHNYLHLTLPEPQETWVWNVAPIPEFQKDIGIKMRVSGFVLKNTNSH